MNYLKIYTTLCRRGINRKLDCQIKSEIHHVFPESIYGENNLTSTLTTREHLVAHMCLLRAFIKRYGMNDLSTKKMAMAVHKMVYRLSRQLNCRITSRHYEAARLAARLSKIGTARNDMKGKAYFGASEDAILAGIEKMRKKKTGEKINYPKNRKSRIQLTKTNDKISSSRKMTNAKYKLMSSEEFTIWVNSQKLFMKDGRKNGNVTRAIVARNEQIEKYYG